MKLPITWSVTAMCPTCGLPVWVTMSGAEDGNNWGQPGGVVTCSCGWSGHVQVESHHEEGDILAGEGTGTIRYTARTVDPVADPPPPPDTFSGGG